MLFEAVMMGYLRQFLRSLCPKVLMALPPKKISFRERSLNAPSAQLFGQPFMLMTRTSILVPNQRA